MWNSKDNKMYGGEGKGIQNVREKKKRSEEEEFISDAVLVSRKEKQQFYEVLTYEFWLKMKLGKENGSVPV